MKIIATILITLILMFCTTFLLEIEIIKQHWVRTGIIYILIIAELLIGLKLVKYMVKSV